MKRLAIVLCLFAALPVWAEDDCVQRGDTMVCNVPIMMPHKPPTTRWLGDEQRKSRENKGGWRCTLELMDGDKQTGCFDIGLRSDGVMVWREPKP